MEQHIYDSFLFFKQVTSLEVFKLIHLLGNQWPLKNITFFLFLFFNTSPCIHLTNALQLHLIPHSCSSNWKKLMQLRGVVRSMIRMQVGNGNRTFFWGDNWLPIGPLNFQASPALLQNMPIISLHSAGMRAGTSRKYLLCNFLLQISPPSAATDTTIWIPSPSGDFSLSHTIDWLAPHHQPKHWQHLVWHSFSIPSCKFTLSFQRMIPNVCNLSLGLDPTSFATGPRSYLFCHSFDESHEHIFFSCSFINPIWSFLQSKCKLRDSHSSWSDFINWAAHRWRRQNLQNSINKLVLSTTVNQIWMERNERAFSNKRSTQTRVLNRTMDLVKHRLVSFTLKDSHTAKRILLEWDLPQSFIRPPREPD